MPITKLSTSYISLKKSKYRERNRKKEVNYCDMIILSKNCSLNQINYLDSKKLLQCQLIHKSWDMCISLKADSPFAQRDGIIVTNPREEEVVTVLMVIEETGIQDTIR